LPDEVNTWWLVNDDDGGLLRWTDEKSCKIFAKMGCERLDVEDSKHSAREESGVTCCGRGTDGKFADSRGDEEPEAESFSLPPTAYFVEFSALFCEVGKNMSLD
jgi:hypothetical protein